MPGQPPSRGPLRQPLPSTPACCYSPRRPFPAGVAAASLTSQQTHTFGSVRADAPPFLNGGDDDFAGNTGSGFPGPALSPQEAQGPERLSQQTAPTDDPTTREAPRGAGDRAAPTPRGTAKQRRDLDNRAGSPRPEHPGPVLPTHGTRFTPSPPQTPRFEQRAPAAPRRKAEGFVFLFLFFLAIELNRPHGASTLLGGINEDVNMSFFSKTKIQFRTKLKKKKKELGGGWRGGRA